jgi:hypothetical protein
MSSNVTCRRPASSGGTLTCKHDASSMSGRSSSTMHSSASTAGSIVLQAPALIKPHFSKHYKAVESTWQCGGGASRPMLVSTAAGM